MGYCDRPFHKVGSHVRLQVRPGKVVKAQVVKSFMEANYHK